MQLHPYITIHYMGRSKKYFFRLSSKLPHPNMQPRNEINAYLFGHRFAITWYFGND